MSVPHPRRVTSFARRGGRMPQRHRTTLERVGERYLIDPVRGEASTSVAGPIDVDAAFGRTAPLIVEVGSGAGEQIVAHAAAHPDINHLALDVWWPGIAAAIHRAEKVGITNLRIIYADATSALGQLSRPVDELWTFFPDPWPKKRHRKRRLVTESFARQVGEVLAEDGVWRLATDWADYAWQMRDAIAAAGLVNQHAGERPDPDDPSEAGITGGFAPRYRERIVTRFETKGVAAGRQVYDLVATRA
ncbi:MAG: tRNA (guanosine(46)-N7)-methyltransferase TrmB [Flaviflexus sp.]|nr:tRNA (guanosine(46)-N7)-methyltransferase TrmB [Flaviflexus sp.]